MQADGLLVVGIGRWEVEYIARVLADGVDSFIVGNCSMAWFTWLAAYLVVGRLLQSQHQILQ